MRFSTVVLMLRDRRVLERTIFPYILKRESYRKILFVGCHWYTERYNSMFSQRDYYTMDIDPTRKRFGSAHHIVGALEDLAAHFQRDELDAIICNGVVGWGLDDRAAAERAFFASHECLAPGGLLLVGWNDVEKRRPFRLEELEALRRFERFEMEALGTWRFQTRGLFRHVFDFYTKARSE